MTFFTYSFNLIKCSDCLFSVDCQLEYLSTLISASVGLETGDLKNVLPFSKKQYVHLNTLSGLLIQCIVAIKISSSFKKLNKYSLHSIRFLACRLSRNEVKHQDNSKRSNAEQRYQSEQDYVATA